MTRDDVNLACDPTGGTEVHRPDDRFIPIRSCELADALADDAEQFGVTRDEILCVARAIEEVIDQEVSAFERDLTDRYAAFNPDRDTIPQGDVAQTRNAEGYADLRARLDYLLGKANFVRLTEAQIRSAIEKANSFGLRIRVRPERLAHLGVWVRGQTTTDRNARTWRHPIRGEQKVLTVYRRLATVTQLSDSPYVNLKLFKEIPIADVEALLPNADVEMSWIDRLKVAGGGAGVIGSTGAKIFNLLTGIIYWSKLAWILLAGAGLLVYRAITGYRRARADRDSLRTRHLYYQNLDNNAGVIHTLVSMIAQEEVKEAVLAYCFCRGLSGKITKTAELDSRVEAYMANRFGTTVDFDVQDAVETLTRFGLWVDRDRFEVSPPEQAARALHDHWQSRRSATYHDQCVSE